MRRKRTGVDCEKFQPLNDSVRFIAKTNGTTYYIKVAADRHLRMLADDEEKAHRYLSRLTPELAKNTAYFHQELVDRGVFPPGTQFLVCEIDVKSKRYPTYMAIMPMGEESGDMVVVEGLDRCVQELNRFGLKSEDLFFDVEEYRNYLKFSDGRAYLIDLHLFNKDEHLFLLPDRL